MEKQCTINSPIYFEGTGLHTGQNSKIELLPARADTGIVFVRTDLPSPPMIKADLNSVVPAEKFPRRTVIGSPGAYVQTIEHLMAALSLSGIDNAQVNIAGEEVPGLDGSAKDFVAKIKAAGTRELDAPKNYLVIREPFWIDDNGSSLVILPYPLLRVSYTLKYDHKFIGSSYAEVVVDGSREDNFYEARTFCLQDEANSLLDMGLGKGSNYSNTLVVSENGVIDNALRFPDEFAKHKILDLIGDLYLVGPLKGYALAVKSGHSSTIKLLQKISKNRQDNRSAGIPSARDYVSDGVELAVEQIMKILPHRYPFLLVDKILHLEKGKRAVGIKNVTMNEYFFQGHFPGRPVMPGVLLIEAMAQVGGVCMLTKPGLQGKLAFFMAADNIKFRKVVEPGDQLVMEVEVMKARSRVAQAKGVCKVDGEVVCEAEMTFAFGE